MLNTFSCAYLLSVFFFCAMSVHVFCRSSNCFFLSFPLSFESSLDVLVNCLLLDMRFTNIFSEFVSCIFDLLMGSCAEQNFLNVDKVLK